MTIYKNLLFHKSDLSYWLLLRNYCNQHIQACLWSVRKLTRMPVASFFALLIISITLTLPVVLNSVLQTAQVFTQQWYTQETLSLYLKPNMDASRLSALSQMLRTHPDIKGVRYISPEQGLKELSEQDATIGTIGRLLDENPLPGVFVIEPKPSISVDQLETLHQQLASLPGVDNAQFDLGWVKRLHAFVYFSKQALFLLAVLLGLGVLLVISNTIHLSIQGHETEMDVLDLMGATRGYIRRPFLYTGVLMGLIGGVMAWMLATIALTQLNGSLRALALTYGSQLSLYAVSGQVIVFLVVGGGSLGLIGALMGIRTQTRQRLWRF